MALTNQITLGQWRGVVPSSELPNNWMPKIASNFVGPGKHMGVYYLRDQKLANFVGVVKDPTCKQEAWMTQAPWRQLQADFSGWHPIVQQIINAADREQCFRWALVHRPPLKNWSSERVTLLGDAAHPSLPFMASGAAMAIEDSLVLSRALKQERQLDDGLQVYQRNRIPRTRYIQNTSVKMGKLYHLPSRYLQRLAFKSLRSLGRKTERVLAGYDASHVLLN